MRKIILLVFLALPAWCQCGPGQTRKPIGNGQWSCVNTSNVVTKDPTTGSVAIGSTLLGPYTIAAGANQIPSAVGRTGQITVATDCESQAACAVGGGSVAAFVRSNGTTWVIFGGGVGTNYPSCTKYTIAYTDPIFTAAATAATKTIRALGANEAITAIRIKHSAAYAGTGITSATVALGDGTTADYYAPSFNVFQAVANTTLWADGGLAESTAAAHNLVATFAANTNWGNGSASVLTGGSVDIHVCSVVLP